MAAASGVELARRHCELLQQLSQPRAALTVAVTARWLFAGIVDNDDTKGIIQVWHVRLFHLEKELRGHTRGVSSLAIVDGGRDPQQQQQQQQQQFLVSAAHDCTVRLWDIEQLECLCVLRPRLLVGNIFSLAATTDGAHLFLGCQNASIQTKAIDLDVGLFAGSRPAQTWAGVEARQDKRIDCSAPEPEAEPASTPYLMSSSHSANARAVFAAQLLSAVPLPRQSQLMAAEGDAIAHAAQEDNARLAGSTPAPPTPMQVDSPGYTPVPLSARSPRGSMLASVDKECNFTLSHFGYVYCLATAKLVLPDAALSSAPPQEVLISGSGDGTVKLWRWHASPPKLQLLHQLAVPGGPQRAVLSLLVHEGLLYCGLQGGHVAIWDLETLECTRQLEGHSDDVNALVVCKGHIFSGSADGTVRMIGRSFECLEVLRSKKSGRMVLSLAAFDDMLIVGSNAGAIEVWRVPPQSKPTLLTNEEDAFLAALEQFVALRTVSSDETLREECRRGAKFLNKLCQQLGAESKLVAGATGKNPVVVARFLANDRSLAPDAAVPTLLFYGHYDIQPAEEKEWNTPPFTLTGINGYLYGRGATDNKGPVLAALFGTSELWREERLPVNVILLVEGEEESGSEGISVALSSCNGWLNESGDVDCILIANTYWLGDNIPCVTYGLRGVVRATVEVLGLPEDLHSGVDGGVVAEPLVDLLHLLASLRDSQGRVAVPHFYDNLRQPEPAELARYEQLAFDSDKYSIRPPAAGSVARSSPHVADDANGGAAQPVDGASSDGVERTGSGVLYVSQAPAALPSKAQILSARWYQPTLSVHNVQVSGPGTNTVIPSRAWASVSMRLVPDQNVEHVTHELQEYLLARYRQLGTRNHMRITVTDMAGWWLGEKDGAAFEAAKDAIRTVWKIEPQLVREGGTIPVTRFLEDWFKAPAVHLPLGQCTDAAHLPNERIRVRNLQLGREVIQQFTFNLFMRAQAREATGAMSAKAAAATPPATQTSAPLKRKRSSFKFSS